MVFTLFCAREAMRGDADLVVRYGDIVYEPRVLSVLLASAAPLSVAVDRQWRRYGALRMADPLADAETLELGASGGITELGKTPSSLEEIPGQSVGLFKVRADRVEAFAATTAEMERAAAYDGKDFRNMNMTSFLEDLIDRGWPVQSVPVGLWSSGGGKNGSPWVTRAIRIRRPRGGRRTPPRSARTGTRRATPAAAAPCGAD